jgi:hypothetical protein
MQSLNPFSFTWAGGKFYDRMNKLNVIGGSLERHQLAGRDYFKGLGQAPQDIFLQKKGVAYTARTEDFNPGETIGTYRMEMRADATMAEYLFRTRAKDPTFMFDKGLYEDAMNTTTRRTVSAEALALRRDQELRAFGMMANPIIGWANPISFLWHMPVPLFPQSLTPKEIAAKYVARSKHGYGESFGAGMKKMAEDMTQSAAKFFQPHKIVNIVYCPKCGMSNVRGSACKNQGCRQAMY